MKQTDARVRYTKMIIQQSFLSLLRIKPCVKITVTELCQKAEINRATFYKHYLDIPDLMERMEEELLEKFRSVVSDVPFSYKTFMLDLLHYIHENVDRIAVLTSENGNPGLMAHAFMLSTENAYPLFELIPLHISEPLRPLIYNFICHGTGGLLTTWITEGLKQSPEEINHMILTLCETALSIYKEK